jgi:hypothetical protein
MQPPLEDTDDVGAIFAAFARRTHNYSPTSPAELRRPAYSAGT